MRFQVIEPFAGTSGLVSPEIDARTVTEVRLMFRHGLSHVSGGDYRLSVWISTDDGGTWENEPIWSYSSSDNIPNAMVTIDLSEEYIGKKLKLKWVLDGDALQPTTWSIDDIVVLGHKLR